jgi:heat shock protein 4
MVGFNDSRSMGEGAQIQANSNFRNTIKFMKQFIGIPFEDPRAQSEMSRVPFTCVPVKHASGGPDSIGVKVTLNSEETVLPIENVAGIFFKHMGTIVAERNAETSTADVKDLFPTDWVITIPGFYTDAQRRALLAGCQTVKMDGVQRLMHEHTATALAFGIFKDIRKEFTKDKPTKVMFLDIGASSYSVCVATFEPGKLMVNTAQFDATLGGREFDQIIAEWLAAKFEEKFAGKLSAKPMDKPKVVLKLLTAAERAKKTLSPAGVKEARINLECLMDDLDFNCVLTAEEYEKMAAPLLARLAAPIERALAETKLKVSDLSSVEIVGGSSRIGCVKRELAKILGLDAKAVNNGLSTTMNADEAVARGAALQSAILSPRFKVLPYEIVEQAPFPVKVSWEGDEGIEVADGTNGVDIPTNAVVMFDRGSNFNCVRRVTLRKSGDFKVTASYDSSAGSYGFPEGSSKDIAVFTVKCPEGNENKVRVNIKQDIHGTILLSSAQMVEEIEEIVEAEMKEPETKEGEAKEGEAPKEEGEAPKPEKKKKVKKTNLEFSENRPMEWTSAEMDKGFEKEVAMANADRVVKETGEKRNELETYIYDMRDKISSESQLGSYVTDEDKATFTSALEKSENWLYEEGFDAVKSVYSEKLDALKAMGTPIESRQYEAKGRPNAISALQRTVEKYTNWVNTSQGDAEYEHITQEEFTKCREACDTTASWMYEIMDKQGALAQNQDPAVTIAELNGKTYELTKLVNPTMHKPKPKPKAEEKKEEPKEETKKEEPAPAKDASPMETEEPAAEEKPTDMETD